MATEQLVDVVVPTLGQKPSLFRTVSALLAQATVNRIVVAATGPFNRSAAVAEVEHLARVHVVRSTSKLPAGAARNLGAKSVETDFIGFCDDDDVWSESVGRVLVEAAAGCGAAAGTLHRVGPGMKCERVWAFGDCVGLDDVHYWNPGITGSNLVLERAVFEDSGRWSEVLPSLNDLEFLTRLTRLVSIPIIREAPVVVDLTHNTRIGVERPRPAEDLRLLLLEPLAERGARKLCLEAELQLARFEGRLAQNLVRHPASAITAGRYMRHTLRRRLPFGELNRGCGRDHGDELRQPERG